MFITKCIKIQSHLAPIVILFFIGEENVLGSDRLTKVMPVRISKPLEFFFFRRNAACRDVSLSLSRSWLQKPKKIGHCLPLPWSRTQFHSNGSN